MRDTIDVGGFRGKHKSGLKNTGFRGKPKSVKKNNGSAVPGTLTLTPNNPEKRFNFRIRLKNLKMATPDDPYVDSKFHEQ